MLRTASLFALLTLLTACGGGQGPAVLATPEPPPAAPVTPAPAISYSTPVSWVAGEAVTPIVPSNAGGPATSFSAVSGKPAGITLDPATGRISGTPDSAQPQTPFVVRASGPGGDDDATVNVSVRDGVYEVVYATFIGGSEREGSRAAIPAADGSVLIGGQTASTNFPTTAGAFQTSYAGEDPSVGHEGTYGGDLYVARLNAQGTALLASTYFGGSKQERSVYGMALDGSGNVVITTTTRSTDIPTTAGAFQTTYGGGPADMVVAKLAPDLKTLRWCTYVGGVGDETPRGGLAIDSASRVILAGETDSTDFPTTQGAYQRALRGVRDSAIVKIGATGTSLVWSTLLGGNGNDRTCVGVQLDATGNVYLAGHTEGSDFPVTADAPQATIGGQFDCYVAKLSSNGASLLSASYLGGSANEFGEPRPWLLSDNSLLVTGFTASADFPTTAGAYQRTRSGPTDGFLTRWAPDGKSFTFSTFLGGTGGEFLEQPKTDAAGNIWVVGRTTSSDLPVTPDAFQKTYGGGNGDGFVAALSADGSQLLYCSYLGGSGEDLIRNFEIAANGDVFLTGKTDSSNFPVTPGAYQTTIGGSTDAFVVKLARQ